MALSSRRRSAAHSAAHQERWLISYADFITLLFAFFVVMFAASQRDRTRAQHVAEAVRESFEQPQLRGAVAGWLAKDRQVQPAPVAGTGRMDALEAAYQSLAEALKTDIANNSVQIRRDERGLVVSLREAAFFPSGGDAIPATTDSIVAPIVRTLAPLPNAIRLEGHTDPLPIQTSRFRSNWELSCARSIAMLRVLTERFGLPERRFVVAGYAATAPVASNDTEADRARNRRVDLVVLQDATQPPTSNGGRKRP